MKKTKLVLKRLTLANLTQNQLANIAGRGGPSQRLDGCSGTCVTCVECTLHYSCQTLCNTVTDICQ